MSDRTIWAIILAFIAALAAVAIVTGGLLPTDHGQDPGPDPPIDPHAELIYKKCEVTYGPYPTYNYVIRHYIFDVSADVNGRFKIYDKNGEFIHSLDYKYPGIHMSSYIETIDPKGTMPRYDPNDPGFTYIFTPDNS